MFMVVLFLAFLFIILLISQYSRSRHKKLITVTICMIMIGMICWRYLEITFAYSYNANENKGVVTALINQYYIFLVGMFLLVLSIPCTLFCLLSKPQEQSELDKLLEDQDDL